MSERAAKRGHLRRRRGAGALAGGLGAEYMRRFMYVWTWTWTCRAGWEKRRGGEGLVVRDGVDGMRLDVHT